MEEERAIIPVRNWEENTITRDSGTEQRSARTRRQADTWLLGTRSWGEGGGRKEKDQLYPEPGGFWPGLWKPPAHKRCPESGGHAEPVRGRQGQLEAKQKVQDKFITPDQWTAASDS